MIHHIKKILLIVVLILTTLNAQNSKFIFEKSIIITNNYGNLHNVYTYTPNEANNLYKNKVIVLDLSICKLTNLIFSEDDNENYNMLHNIYPDVEHNFYSNYILKNLNLNIVNQKKCSLNGDEYFLVNNSHLIMMLNEYFFIFKKQKNNYNLKDIEKNLKEKEQLVIYNKSFFKKNITQNPITKQTLTKYNNIAYYLQKAGASKEAIFILEKILSKYPNRTVAHYNIADAYWDIDDKENAIKYYKIYVKQMKQKGKQNKIPNKIIIKLEQETK